MNNYTIEDHIHISASWIASTAASSSPENRFKVEHGQSILNKSTLKSLIRKPKSLPTRKLFDRNHEIWRNEIIDLSKEVQIEKPFTHGIAAKMINVYLKTIFICGGYHKHTKTRSIHPPIDRILLNKLSQVNFNNRKELWKEMESKGWSKYDADEYQVVIDEIKAGLGRKPLWQIEQYWRGYQ